jgi:hypothetical protein
VQDQVLSAAGDDFKHTSQEENFTFQITEIVQKEKVTFFLRKSFKKIVVHTLLVVKASWEH